MDLLGAGSESGSPSSPIYESTHTDDVENIKTMDSRITVSRRIQLKAIAPCRRELRPVKKRSLD